MVNLSGVPIASEFGRFWQTERIARETTKRMSVPKALYPVHGAGSKQFPSFALWSAVVLGPAIPVLALGFSLVWYPLALLIFGFPIFSVFIYSSSFWLAPDPQHDIKLPGLPLEHYVELRDPALKEKYGGKKGVKMPMDELLHAYYDQKLDFKMDVLQALEHRYDFCSFSFTPALFTYFFSQWVPETLWHTKAQDEDQVREHYDRSDRMYAAFLGPRMVYTSGLVSDPSKRESLEQMQDNKLAYVSERMQFKEGDRHLDIGAGWFTLAIHAAKFHGTHSTGVTLSENQVAFGKRRAAENGVAERVNFLRMDYRDIPKGQKFDKITCLEMAEHVGVLNFGKFLNQASDLLEDDGLFFLQIAGLRRRWTFECLSWGLSLMSRYVFPGADASCPLGWVVNQLECAGFEIREVQTIGVHYSATIDRWYLNWQSNREAMVEEIGERWVRIWDVFLAWSTIIARQGSATCYQILAHKNLNKFDRVKLMRGIPTTNNTLNA
ncbi:hypothetical protein H9P43_005999 [Blastocladiella emersonii ATCC 22665]|nr:hypothetical protein H9P43_005999 [Blastocladiella emersonii ATCC 22665]